MITQPYPGLPGYDGPQVGIFAYVHHERRWEPSHNIGERIAYIMQHKPQHEIRTRLACLRYLDLSGVVPAEILAEGVRLWTESKRLWNEGDCLRDEGKRLLRDEGKRLLRDEGKRLLKPYRAQIDALVEQLVPHAPWEGGELRFSDEEHKEDKP